MFLLEDIKVWRDLAWSTALGSAPNIWLIRNHIVEFSGSYKEEEFVLLLKASYVNTYT